MAVHDRILSDLDRHQDLFDLTKDRLGEKATEIAMEGAKTAFDGQRKPDGSPWEELSENYKPWKDRHYPGQPMGVLTGLMRSEMDGEIEVAQDSAAWIFGTSDEGRELAEWFQEGDPYNNRPDRPFADLNEASIKLSDDLFDEHFNETLR